MGLIADEQSAMAHVHKTAGKARTWVAPGSAGKTGPLKRILRGRFHADRRENGAKPGIFAEAGFTRARSEGVRGDRLRGTAAVWESEHLMTVGRCVCNCRGVIVEFPTLPRGPGYGATDPGAYCSSCAVATRAHGLPIVETFWITSLSFSGNEQFGAFSVLGKSYHLKRVILGTGKR